MPNDLFDDINSGVQTLSEQLAAWAHLLSRIEAEDSDIQDAFLMALAAFLGAAAKQARAMEASLSDNLAPMPGFEPMIDRIISEVGRGN